MNAGSDESLEMDGRVSIEAWVYPTDSSGGIIVNKEGEFISNQSLPPEPDDEDNWNVTEVLVLDVR